MTQPPVPKRRALYLFLGVLTIVVVTVSMVHFGRVGGVDVETVTWAAFALAFGGAATRSMARGQRRDGVALALATAGGLSLFLSTVFGHRFLVWGGATGLLAGGLVLVLDGLDAV
ncbi:hypothetical protein VB779_01755 [Haloarculaceae archaeon H-GB11]|nr:hypothetical protein [Haloarculaceae archaeon H-GB11]